MTQKDATRLSMRLRLLFEACGVSAVRVRFSEDLVLHEYQVLVYSEISSDRQFCELVALSNSLFHLSPTIRTYVTQCEMIVDDVVTKRDVVVFH